MSTPWFRVHKFWGWYPISWQAWIVIAAMAVSTAGIFFLVDSSSHSVSETIIGSFPPISLIVTSAIFIALMKGERPVFGGANVKKKDYSPDDPKIYILLPILSSSAGLYYLVLDYMFGSVLFFIEALVLYIIYKELVLLAKNE